MKALSGFYYVQCEAGLVACRARGRLRKAGISPLVGDLAEISLQDGTGMVERILPRRNRFIRPAVSNLDQLVVLASAVIPVTEPFLIDRVAAIAGSQNVPVLICINKIDLDPAEELTRIYTHAGFQVVRTSAETGAGVEELRQAVAGRVSALAGNSGVGKSSLLNCLQPGFSLQTGEVSEKLGRGRHTTRHVELYALPEDTLVADTPGFSAFDTERMDLVLKDSLQYAFPDFAPYLGRCQFDDCAHLKEPGCAVRAALARGDLEQSRYDSYVRLYERAEEIREWELKKS